MSTAALGAALEAAGIHASVEERGRLAIIVARSAAHAQLVGAKREWIATTAAAHGFSHVALEVMSAAESTIAPPLDAALPGH